MQYYHFYQLYKALDENEDLKITRDELTAYYTQQGGMTALEVSDKVEEFFQKYNTGETNGFGDDNVGKWELWIKMHWEKHVEEYNDRRDHRNALNLEELVLKPYDDNHDSLWSYEELLNHMSIEQALEIYSIFGKDPMGTE